MAGLSIRRILTTNLQSSVMGLSGHFHYGSRPIAVGAARIADGCERAKRPPGVAVLRELDLFTSRHQQQVRPGESTRIAQSNRPLAAPTQIGGKETTK
jgi:hypothetical protein